MKVSTAPWKAALAAVNCPGELDFCVTLGRLRLLLGSAAIVQAVADPRQFAWQGHSHHEDEIARLLKQRSLQSTGLLVRWMVSRRIRTIETWATALHPAFTPRPIQATMTEECSALVSELGDGMPDWRIASWFGSPNPRLFNLTPADMLPCDWHVIVDAARLDRLDARGKSNL